MPPGATIGSLRVELATNVAKFGGDMNKAGGMVGRFSKTASMGMKTVAIGAGIAATAIVAAGAAAIKLGQRGAGIADVAREFDLLSSKVGETGDAMLGSLRRGVSGTISDFELMKAANKAMGAGLNATAEDMETLALGARLLAKRVGVDTTQAIEQLTNAMATGRTQGIKSLGLFVDLAASIDVYQEQTGKLESELTDADRRRSRRRRSKRSGV